jgi:hypothetical protein
VAYVYISSKKILFGSVGTSFVCIRDYGIQLRLGYDLMIIVRTRAIMIASILLSSVGGVETNLIK